MGIFDVGSADQPPYIGRSMCVCARAWVQDADWYYIIFSFTFLNLRMES